MPGPKRKPLELVPDNVRSLTTSGAMAKIVGQNEFSTKVEPYLGMLSHKIMPYERPAGIFFLAGPTGVGKTFSVECLAEFMHGNKRNLLRIDCAEYQMEHEVAKLIGAPPGYIGHRETQPVLTQMKLNQVVSERCNIAIVLFDEIEKASPALMRLLLGVLDRGILRLGDNTTVSFERTLIFFTSNIGVEESTKVDMGLGKYGNPLSRGDKSPYSRVLQKTFPPELVNRLDEIIVFSPLTKKDMGKLFEQELANWNERITRSRDECFNIEATSALKNKVIDACNYQQYGARDLKREIFRQVISPVVTLSTLPTGETIRVGPRGVVK